MSKKRSKRLSPRNYQHLRYKKDHTDHKNFLRAVVSETEKLQQQPIGPEMLGYVGEINLLAKKALEQIDNPPRIG